MTARALRGSVAGLLIAVAVAVLATAVSVFVALRSESDTALLGVASVDYTATQNGGFELGLASGTGLLLLLLTGLVVGAIVGAARGMRGEGRRATPRAL